MMRAPAAPPDNLFPSAPPRQADVFAPRTGGIERDEFSSVAAGGSASQQPGAGANVPAPAAKTNSSNLPVILIVGGLLLVAIVLVVVFAFVR